MWRHFIAKHGIGVSLIRWHGNSEKEVCLQKWLLMFELSNNNQTIGTHNN